MRWLFAVVFVCSFMNYACAINYYVDASRPNDYGTGLSRSLAKKTIMGAVSLANDGDNVFVAAGVYDYGAYITPFHASFNRVVITNNISVIAESGPESTFIMGSADRNTAQIGPTAVRCVYMSRGRLIGFTLKNGYTSDKGSIQYDQSGGGVNAYGGLGIISNCVITSCEAGQYGGGSYGGRLYGCTIKNNTAYYGGGGGSGSGTLERCIVTQNSGGLAGGGCYSCILYSSLIINNFVGGGSGGGAFGSTLTECTVCKNVADLGGGTDACALHESIVWYNTANQNNDIYNSSADYTCSPDVTNGVSSCITNEPVFVDLQNDNYRLQVTSPCIGRGRFQASPTSTDLDGKKRVMAGPDLNGDGFLIFILVDLGAYEWAHTIANDFNGDRNSDMAVLDQGTGSWFMRSVAGAQIGWNINWGWPGVEGVAGDYDGDGKADLAVFDQGTGRWFVRAVDGKQLVWQNFWGWPGVRPVAGDYDGDGVSDLAIMDQGTGRWFIKKTVGLGRRGSGCRRL